MIEKTTCKSSDTQNQSYELLFNLIWGMSPEMLVQFVVPRKKLQRLEIG